MLYMRAFRKYSAQNIATNLNSGFNTVSCKREILDWLIALWLGITGITRGLGQGKGLRVEICVSEIDKLLNYRVKLIINLTVHSYT